MDLFLLSVTILPPVLIVIIFAVSDKFKEPNKEIFLVFISGILITIPAYIANTFLHDLYLNYSFIDKGLAASFLSAAVVEEGLKFLVLYFVVYRLREFNEPMDAMVYGAAIGLGYAAMENVGYLNISVCGSEPWSISGVKCRYYPMIMHLSFGVLMGWLLSQNLFEERSIFKRRLMLILALSLPVIFHGAFNYYGQADIFPALALIFVLVIIYYFRREQLQYITED